MKNYFSQNVRIYFLIIYLLAGLWAFQSCSDPARPPISVENNVFTNITGEYNLKFEAPGNMYIVQTDQFEQYSCQSQANIKGTLYTLNIIVVFPDKQEKLGEFPFRSSKGPIVKDCAFGNFEIGQGTAQKTFSADSGTIVLTKLDGSKVEGTFHFYATNPEGRRIEITEGVMKF